MNKEHIPVLLDEVKEGLNIKKNGIYIDGTFGRGGHSQMILSQLGSKGRLIGIDRDPEASESLNKVFEKDERFKFIKNEMANIKEITVDNFKSDKIDGILLDLGVSSPQLDNAHRGFSFQKEGPLDMRMDSNNGISAAKWIEKVSENKLRHILFKYGEERFSSRIARAIVRHRKEKPIKTTKELADIVKSAYPKTHQKKHPATKTFQAIRIYINDELKQLEKALTASIEILDRGGRICVISFHSLEDRIVKRFMKSASLVADQYRGLPEVPDDYKPKLKIIGKAIKSKVDEISHNIRSRSAVLRVAERL